jgi:choline dehydrogenase-like flavoprotein
MSENPSTGVVDQNCRIHGVHGLYVSGASVFPTSGHANPTLMILALAIRLADTIKSKFATESLL